MTISVVIPAYNGSRFIERAILSVLAQTRPPDEILVCDDNSTDDTLVICQRYADRLSIYSNPDGPSGFVNGWNEAIERATGDYITILHQDDTLDPELLKVAATALTRNPLIRHLFCTCQYIDEQDKVLSLSYESAAPPTEILYTGREYFAAYQRQGQPHIHRCPGVLTHRSIFSQCRYEPAAGHMADDDFFYRVGQYTDVIGILLPLAAFRLHAGSVTGSLDDIRLAGQLMEDYVYQCRQWKGHPFIDPAGYAWFVRNAHKYIRRTIGYSLQAGRLTTLLKALRQWAAIQFI
jgi:glycosyltransferase involved in cell wall biosynthesis